MKKYSGVLVPMITPFTEDQKIDCVGLENILRHLLKEGCHPFVMGTTGESLSILPEEAEKLIHCMIKLKNKETLFYASVSDVNSGRMIRRAKRYADLGIDVVVAHVPTQYPLSDSAILRWFELLADQSPCPVMIYNMPGTTHISVPLDIADELSQHPNIVGMKDSERDENRLKESLNKWKDRSDFSHLIGWAPKSYEALKLGSDGLVPSSGNLFPALYTNLYEAMQNGEDALAQNLQNVSDEVGKLYQKDRLLPDSLSALKVLLHYLGLCEKNVLPPLKRLDETDEKETIERFQEYYSKNKTQLK